MRLSTWGNEVLGSEKSQKLHDGATTIVCWGSIVPEIIGIDRR